MQVAAEAPELVRAVVFVDPPLFRDSFTQGGAFRELFNGLQNRHNHPPTDHPESY